MFGGVQYGTACRQNCVLVTVSFSFVRGFKTSKHNNTHFKNKHFKKKFSRTPLIGSRIIELSKNADPHLGHAAPMTFITMDLDVPKPNALGGPTSHGNLARSKL